MVVRAGHTTRDAAVAARQRFDEDGTKVLGTILNDWNPKNSPDGYYGYYKSYTSSYQPQSPKA
jgi:polysaccharide biosynthesis transport protein